MKIYLTTVEISTITSICEIEKRAYKNFTNSLENIYNNLKSIISKEIDDCACEFFNRDYVRKYFTEDFFKEHEEQFYRINFKSPNGEFYIKKINDNKYQFVFYPYDEKLKNINYLIVCELEILELLN
jgi:hypothetical protein